MPRTDSDQEGGQVAGTLERIERRLERIEGLLAQGPAAGHEWLSIKQAAHVTGLSQAHVRRAVRAGGPAASNVGTQSRPIWRIARADLAKWMEENRVQNPLPSSADLRVLVQRYFPKG